MTLSSGNSSSNAQCRWNGNAQPPPPPPQPFIIPPPPWSAAYPVEVDESELAPPPAPPRFRPPPPDWDEEMRERERLERDKSQSGPEPVEPTESLQPRPAPKRAKPARTPRLDALKRELAEEQKP